MRSSVVILLYVNTEVFQNIEPLFITFIKRKWWTRSDLSFVVISDSKRPKFALTVKFREQKANPEEEDLMLLYGPVSLLKVKKTSNFSNFKSVVC